MKPVFKLKITIDFWMSLALLLLMAYGLVGEKAHEWIGMGMLALFLLHHFLNRSWLRNLGKGRYSPLRMVQTVLAALLLFCMLCSMISGIFLSKYIFSFLSGIGSYEFFVKMHILGAYWGLVLMSVHLGLHWNLMLAVLGKYLRPNRLRCGFFWLIAAIIAVCGVRAFFRQNIGTYLLLKSHFVFFDFARPLALFLLDYLSIMGLFVLVGYLLSALLKRIAS